MLVRLGGGETSGNPDHEVVMGFASFGGLEYPEPPEIVPFPLKPMAIALEEFGDVPGGIVNIWPVGESDESWSPPEATD